MGLSGAEGLIREGVDGESDFLALLEEAYRGGRHLEVDARAAAVRHHDHELLTLRSRLTESRSERRDRAGDGRHDGITLSSVELRLLLLKLSALGLNGDGLGLGACERL